MVWPLTFSAASFVTVWRQLFSDWNVEHLLGLVNHHVLGVIHPLSHLQRFRQTLVLFPETGQFLGLTLNWFLTLFRHTRRIWFDIWSAFTVLPWKKLNGF